jgi:hypothetical protein
MNLINPFSDIPSLPTLDLGRIGGDDNGYGGAYDAMETARAKSLAGIPSMTSMPSPAAPMGGGGGGGSRSQSASFGGGGGPSIDTQGQLGSFNMNLPANFTINVSGGISTSAEIGESVVNAIRAYNRAAGPANIAVA